MPPTPEQRIDEINKEEMKMTSTGAVKDPVTGASAKASDSNPAVKETSAQKAMREAKEKFASQTPAANKPATADKPNPDAVKSPDKVPDKTGETVDLSNAKNLKHTNDLATRNMEKGEESLALNEEQAQQQTFEEGITDLKGELKEGSFSIQFKKAGVQIRIPVSMETSRDTYTLDNTFTLIKDIQSIKTKKELEEKYASFLPEGV